MITSIPEYMLHYQLDYLEEQSCLKIYNDTFFFLKGQIESVLSVHGFKYPKCRTDQRELDMRIHPNPLC